MGKKKCEDEKKRKDAVFNAWHDSFEELWYAERDTINGAEDYYKYCDPEKLKELSGNKLEGAQNACDDVREVFGKAIARWKEASTKYKKIDEQFDKAIKDLSDCEHKKKKGEK